MVEFCGGPSPGRVAIAAFLAATTFVDIALAVAVETGRGNAFVAFASMATLALDGFMLSGQRKLGLVVIERLRRLPPLV